MAEKPKNVKHKRGKGFYVAMYSSLGGLLVLAVAIGYYSLLGPGASDDQDVFNIAEISLPVSGTHDVPVVQVPPQTTPAQQRDEDGTVTNQPNIQNVPPEQTTPNEEARQPDAPPQTQPEEQDEPTFAPYEVFEPQGPSFSLFTANDDMHWPLLGDIVMDFSIDAHIWDITMDQWRTNDSISIRANSGDAVRAAADGIVHEVTQTARHGQTVVIDHGNGWLTTYKQLADDVAIAVGDVVNRGQIIGSVGSP
ncbi:MAG: peptidoglycan DD-metalloendopeptidase family protein, partial [Defluviitaleaceae bacterium]|nr:peptidoglycan DD-metalloendopeptidase family protein [Defluviitaleaceae bacterium]